jgi:hypothetical protein
MSATRVATIGSTILLLSGGTLPLPDIHETRVM